MKKVLVLFGGPSCEHDISIQSGLYVSKNIDKERYEVTNSYIDRNGNFYLYKDKNYDLSLGKKLESLERISNIFKFLKEFDIVFPVLHGTYGEDGSVQGLLECLSIPYVGSKVLGSSLAMDKVYAKIVLSKANIKNTKFCYLKVKDNNYIFVDKELNEKACNKEKLIENIEKELGYPMFVKPSNSGSSIGITKVYNKKELFKAIDIASNYDYKILVEKSIIGRELECGILETDKIIASSVGEIIPAGDFYDFNSKYKDDNSKTDTCPNIDEDIKKEIQNIAIKAFKVLDLKGIARVDFFLDENNNIYLNEVNTMPGFTKISMYPKLFEEIGIKIKELLSNLIENL